MQSKEDIKNTIQKLFLDVQNEDNVDIVNDLSKLFDTDNFNVLYNQIENNIVSTIVNRQNEADISTPKALVNEMLDKLPGEVWSNRALQWFDPAVGRGIFMIEVYRRLMDGLTDIFKNSDNRRDYILNNMLYMSELNPINVEITKSIFNYNYNNRISKCNTHNEKSNYLKIELHKNLNIKININTIIKEQKENSIEFELANPDELHQYIQDSNNSKMIDNKDLVRAFLELNLKPKEKEKKQFGEVFTPQTLINTMLDKLPAEVWKDATLKWFDPAVGIGNFMIEIYYRLMEGLVESFPDFETRKTHIISNMLYMSELNPANTKTCRRIFGNGLNIYEGDTLKMPNNYFGVDAFDIVVGNPPYNDASGNRGKGHTLWTNFVEFALKKWISQDGYLVFVHPGVWREPNHPIGNMIRTKNLMYLEIHNEMDGMKVFKANTRYDLYLLQNRDYQGKTIIKDQNGKIQVEDLSKWTFIPNYMFDKIKLLINGFENVQIMHSESVYDVRRKWMSHQKSNIYRFPVVYSVNKKNEISVKWTSDNTKGMFGTPKVIFGSGATGFFVDKEGTYGLTQWATGIVDTKNNLVKIMKCLNSEAFKEVIKATSVGKAEINRKILKLFRKDFYNFI